MSLSGSPLGASSVVQTVLAYPKTAITVAACCAALAVFNSGGTRSEILSDPVCVEASCPLAEEAPMSTNLPILPPMTGVQNSCPAKPEAAAVVTKKKKKSGKKVVKRNGPAKPRNARAPAILDDCGNIVTHTTSKP